MNIQASKWHFFSIRHNSMTLPTLGIKRDVCASHSLAYSNACFLLSILSSPSFLPPSTRFSLSIPIPPFPLVCLCSFYSCSYKPSNLLLYLFGYFLSPAIRSWRFIRFVIDSCSLWSEKEHKEKLSSRGSIDHVNNGNNTIQSGRCKGKRDKWKISKSAITLFLCSLSMLPTSAEKCTIPPSHARSQKTSNSASQTHPKRINQV